MGFILVCIWSFRCITPREQAVFSWYIVETAGSMVVFFMLIAGVLRKAFRWWIAASGFVPQPRIIHEEITHFTMLYKTQQFGSKKLDISVCNTHLNVIMWIVSKLAYFVKMISSYVKFCSCTKRKYTECDTPII